MNWVTVEKNRKEGELNSPFSATLFCFSILSVFIIVNKFLFV